MVQRIPSGKSAFNYRYLRAKELCGGMRIDPCAEAISRADVLHHGIVTNIEKDVCDGEKVLVVEYFSVSDHQHDVAHFYPNEEVVVC